MSVHPCNSVRFLLPLATLAGLSLAAPVVAQDYPARQISIIVPYSPGTGTDVIARTIGDRISQSLGKPVIIENRPGASGNIGADYAAQSKPDGYTILLTSTSGVINQLSNAPRSNLQRDFEPVAFGGTNAFALAVPTAFPARSVEELVAEARRKPGQLNYAGFNGGIVAFMGDMLKLSTKIDIVMVPYKSTPDAQVDVIAGRVPIWFTTVTAAMPLAKSNRVRILAVSSSRRVAAAPDIPTMKEAGFPELTMEITFMFVVPTGTPKSVIARLNREINTAANSREVIDRLATQGIEPRTGAPEEVGQTLAGELAQWERILATVNGKK